MQSSTLLMAGLLAAGLGGTALANGSAWPDADVPAFLRSLPVGVEGFLPPGMDMRPSSGNSGSPVVVVIPRDGAPPPLPYWHPHERQRFSTGLIACINGKAMFRDENGNRSFVDRPASDTYCD